LALPCHLYQLKPRQLSITFSIYFYLDAIGPSSFFHFPAKNPIEVEDRSRKKLQSLIAVGVVDWKLKMIDHSFWSSLQMAHFHLFEPFWQARSLEAKDLRVEIQFSVQHAPDVLLLPEPMLLPFVPVTQTRV